MSPSPRITRVSLSLLILATGCDLQKIGNQATAKTVAVSTLLTTPPVEIKGTAVAGGAFDAGSLAFDAGAQWEDAGVSIPAQNLAVAFLGQRQGDALDVAPTGMAGAVARLTEVGGAQYPLEDQGGGTYSLLPDAGFVYKDNATYRFEFTLSSQEYVAEVVRVPGRETISTFHPPAGYVELNAGDSLVFNRPDAPQGQDRNLGFINVFPITSQGAQAQPTYTNIPSTPLAFLKLVIVPTDWKSTEVTIPGSAFPSRDANYLVVFQSAKLGGPKSDNLFTGSAILAGTADVAVIKTRK